MPITPKTNAKPNGRVLSINTKTVLKFCGLKALPIDKSAIANVILFEDENCEMAKIEVNGKNLYEGNYWDFHPGCHGLKLDFENRDELVRVVVNGLVDAGYEVAESEQTYVYE